MDLHPLTAESVQRFAPSATLVELPRTDDAYYALLATSWGRGEPFLIVEQDIEIHETVVPELSTCPEPWCLFPYPGPAGAIGDPLIYSSLGCTRFSAELMWLLPDLLKALPSHDWWRLDALMWERLRTVASPHIHEPPVNHHHVRPWLLGHRCDCGEVLP